MTTTSRPLIEAKHAASTETTEYTVPTGTRTIIDKMTAYNGHTSTVAVTVKLVQNGGTAGASNIIESRTLQVGETWGFSGVVGHVLGAGSFISIIAGTASVVVIRASGRENT